MTGYIAYDAHNARHEDFHRRAAEQRRAGAVGAARRSRQGRLIPMIRHRRRPATTRSATTTA